MLILLVCLAGPGLTFVLTLPLAIPVTAKPVNMATTALVVPYILVALLLASAWTYPTPMGFVTLSSLGLACSSATIYLAVFGRKVLKPTFFKHLFYL